MFNSGSEGDRLIEVQARKYDGRIHRRWPARLARTRNSLLVIEAEFTEEIRHPLLGVILPGTLSTEYYWTDRWYNIFRFQQPTGELRNFYCNSCTPAAFDGRVLSFVDLDVDVLVAPDLSFRVLDEEEFAANAEHYRYPFDVRRRARAALGDLISLIEARDFPFSESAAA